MNYIGSKFSLLGFLQESIESVVHKNVLKDMVFCDMFAGTCAVSRAFKDKVKQIIANDLEFYSFVLAQNQIINNKNLSIKELFNELNDESQTPPKMGKIYKHYALGSGSGRQYFSDENAMKIDAIRQKIEIWKNAKQIDQNEYFHLLASLLECSDKVANTASVYGAFLKNLKKSAQKELILEPCEFKIGGTNHQAFNKNANELIKNISGDILYLDPPYNHREYGANYHLLNTIALYDDFSPRGKTGLREYQKSNWCKKNSALDAFDELIKNAKFRYIFFSYNNEGIISLSDIEKTMKKYGRYRLFNTKYRRFKADSNRQHKADETVEYLHFLRKD